MTASTSTGLGVEPVVPSPESLAVEHDGSGSKLTNGDRPRPFARLGAWAATHFRRVLVAWLLVIVAFGFFAVHVESALAGAGWQASGSQSVAARAIIEKNFAGLSATGLQVVVVDHHGPIATDPLAQASVAKATRVLRNDPRVSTVVPPQAGVSISEGRPDRRHHRRSRRELQQDGAGGRRGAAEAGGAVLVRRLGDADR